MVLSTCEKQRIVFYSARGFKPSQILSALRVEGIYTCRQTIARFIKRYQGTGTISRKEGSGRPTKVTAHILQLVERAMIADDETTAVQLHVLLKSCGVRISLSTIIRSRHALGWTFRGSKYCQLIRHANKAKRLEWAQQYHPEFLVGGFENVIWTDETTVQLESHRRHSYRKKGSPAVLKLRAKHPVKVHVWAGISHRGTTPIVIFEGIMNADLYIAILQAGLLPFIRRTYPDSHRLMQDNDPIHTSRKVSEFFEQEGVNWWQTPPQSPDINPIENVWHELEKFIRREVKPSNKSELIMGISRFWTTVNVNKCRKYISHLRKVIPRIIEVEGAATGY